MPIELRFSGGEVLRGLPDDTPEEYIRNLYREYNNWGSLEAVTQRRRVMSLIDDQNFLSLPRIERHKVFNDLAKDGAWWNKIDPVGHRLIRAYIVDREGANPEEAYNYWDSPVRWKEQEQDPNGGVLAEVGNALERSVPKVASYFMRSVPTFLNANAERAMNAYLDYIAPLAGQNEVRARPELRQAAIGMAKQATGKLAEEARRVATDASVGAELLAPPPKVGTFGEVHGWNDFAMYVAQGIGTQAPIMGSIAAATAVNPGLGFAAGMGLEMGTISEDLQKQGFTGAEADQLATGYGVLAGALEAAPIANLLSRNPIVAKGFRQFVTNRLKSMAVQTAEESITEGLQTILEQAAVDFSFAAQDELEKVSWNTPEGRRSLWDEIKESMIQGGLMGGGMGGLLGHAGPENAPGSTAGETAPAAGAAPETPGGGGRAPAVPDFVPIVGETEGTLPVEEDFTQIPTERPAIAPAPAGPPSVPSEMFAPPEFGPAPYAPTEADLADLGPPAEMPQGTPLSTEERFDRTPIAARRLAKSDLGQRTLDYREQNGEQTANDWFFPLSPAQSDGTGWLLYNAAGAANPDTDEVVFATGEIDEVGGEDGMVVLDQDGNRRWLPLVNDRGQPAFFSTSNPGGLEYLRQRSARDSQRGVDITEAADGFNHPYNAEGLTQKEQKAVGEEYVDEVYRNQMEEYNRDMAIQRHVREVKLNGFLRGEGGAGALGGSQYTDEVAGEFQDVRRPFLSKEGLGWDDLATSLKAAGLVAENVDIDEAWLNEKLSQVLKKPIKRKIREELLGQKREGRYVPPETTAAPETATIEETVFANERTAETPADIQAQMREAAAKEGNELDDVQDLTARIYAGEHAMDLLASPEFKGKVTGSAGDLAVRLSEALNNQRAAENVKEELRKEAAPTTEEMGGEGGPQTTLFELGEGPAGEWQSNYEEGIWRHSGLDAVIRSSETKDGRSQYQLEKGGKKAGLFWTLDQAKEAATESFAAPAQPETLTGAAWEDRGAGVWDNTFIDATVRSATIRGGATRYFARVRNKAVGRFETLASAQKAAEEAASAPEETAAGAGNQARALREAVVALETFRRNAKLEAEESGRREADVLATRTAELDRLEAAVAAARKPFETKLAKVEGETEEQTEARRAKTKQLADIVESAKAEAFPLQEAERLAREEEELAFEFQPALTQEKAERIAKKKTERRQENLPLFADQVDVVEAEDIVKGWNQHRVNQDANTAGDGAFAATIRKALKEALPAHVYQGLLRARYAGSLPIDASYSADYWRQQAGRFLQGQELDGLLAKAEAAKKKAMSRWQTDAQGHLFETQLNVARARGRLEPGATMLDVKRVFKGWNVERVHKGHVRISRPGVKPLDIYWVPSIAKLMSGDLVKKIAADYDMPVEEMVAGIQAGKLVINGLYDFDVQRGTHVIALTQPSAVGATLYHEAFHYAFRNYLTKAEMAELIKVHGSEENAAIAFSEFAEARYAGEEWKGKTQQIFEKIYQTALQILEAAGIKRNDAAAIMRKIADGQVWERQQLGFSWDPAGNVRYTPKGPAPAPIASLAADIRDAAAWDDEETMKERLGPKAFDGAIKDAAAVVPVETTKADGDLGAPVVRVQNPTTFFELQTTGDGETTPAGGRIAPETLTEWTRDKVIRKFFAKLEPLKRFQEELTEEGIKIADGLNAWLRARNFTSRAGALTNWVEKNLMDPLLEEIGRLGVDYRDFELFLMSLDALEDNPRLYRMHVVTPRTAAMKELERLKEQGVRRGHKVEVPGHPNQVGKIQRVTQATQELREGEHGQQTIGGTLPATVEIQWRDSITGEDHLEEFPLADVRRTAVAEQEKIIADIEKMVAEGNVPHAGLTSEQAREILLELRNNGWIEFEGDKPNNRTDYRGKFKKAWDLQRKIVHWKENLLVASGLLSKEELARWRRDHTRYTPMRGKARPDLMEMIYGGERPPLPQIEHHGGSVWHHAIEKMARGLGYKGEIFTPNIGRGYNPGKRSAMERRLGRHSMPSHSTLVELLTDTREAAIRAERNRVAKTVWNLFKQLQGIKDADGQPLFELDTKPTRRIYDERTGKIKEVPDDRAYRSAAIYDVWIDGTHHFIRGISPDMAGVMSTLNNIGPAEGVSFLRGLSAINRYLSRMATSRNPAFAIPNVVRDMLTAGIRLTTDYKDLGPKILKDVPKSFQLVLRYNRDSEKLTDAERARVEAWKAAGGETAYWTIPNFERQTKNLGKKIKELSGNANKFMEVGKGVIHWLEDYNGALEAATRFSAFEAARANGATVDQAALVSREITVDFNQQGQLAGKLGTFYMFANASLQGSRMVFRSLTQTKSGRRWLGALMAAGFTQAVIGRIAGGEDPEDGVPYWDKKTAYEKSRNLNVMIPGTKGKSVKVPLPWGFNVPFMAGAMIADVVAPKMGLGGKGLTPGEAAVNTMASAASAFNPIGDGDLTTPQGFAQMAIPSWADTAFDIVINRTWWGGPIAPERTAYKKSEQYGKNSPDYERKFSSVSKFSEELTKLLYKMGIDWSPENVDYAIAGAFGGLGDTINKFVAAPFTLARNGRLAAYEMPIVRSFFAEESTYYAPQIYRANMGDFWLAWETYRDLEKEDQAAAGAFYAKNAEILDMHDTVVDVENILGELKDAGVNINDARQQRVFKRFNRAYERAEEAKIRRLKKKQ